MMATVGIIILAFIIGFAIWTDINKDKGWGGLKLLVSAVVLVLCVACIKDINNKSPEKQKSDKIITPEINVSIELEGDSIISSDTVYIYYFEK